MFITADLAGPAQKALSTYWVLDQGAAGVDTDTVTMPQPLRQSNVAKLAVGGVGGHWVLGMARIMRIGGPSAGKFC